MATEVPRRSFLGGTAALFGVVVAGSVVDWVFRRAEEDASPLAKLAGALGLELVHDVSSWGVGRALTALVSGSATAAGPSRAINAAYAQPGTNAGAFTLKPIAAEAPAARLVYYYTPSHQVLRFEPRAAEALSDSVHQLSQYPGWSLNLASNALLPQSTPPHPDTGGPPGSDHGTTQFYAADGGLVQISYTRTGTSTGVERVQLLNHGGVSFSYEVTQAQSVTGHLILSA